MATATKALDSACVLAQKPSQLYSSCLAPLGFLFFFFSSLGPIFPLQHPTAPTWDIQDTTGSKPQQTPDIRSFFLKSLVTFQGKRVGTPSIPSRTCPSLQDAKSAFSSPREFLAKPPLTLPCTGPADLEKRSSSPLWCGEGLFLSFLFDSHTASCTWVWGDCKVGEPHQRVLL